MKTLCDDVIIDSASFQEQMANDVVEPEPMCNQFEHPDKETAIAQLCTRFNT